MKKKIVIALAVLIGLLFLLALLLPIFLQPKLEALIVDRINDQIEGRFDADDIDLSLFRSFPKASLGINNAHIINAAPFEGDTLFRAKTLYIDMSLWELFRRDDAPRKIRAFSVTDPVLRLKVDKNGASNYDITKKEEGTTDTTVTSTPLVFDISEYMIRNAKVVYEDAGSDFFFEADSIDHKGYGRFSSSKSELVTESSGKLTLSSGGVNWLSGVPASLNADIDMDLENDIYTFQKNEGFIRDLPVSLEGNVQLLDNAQEWNLTFSTPNSAFENLLALLPKEWSQYQKDFDARGSFTLSGWIRGQLSDEKIPTFDIVLNANEGYLKYAGMPKSMERIQLNMHIANATGFTEDTYLDIGNASISIGTDRMSFRSRISELLGKVLIDGDATLRMDLANLKQAYPNADWKALQGRVDGTVSSRFVLDDIRNKRYANTDTRGALNLAGFEYQSAESENPVRIQEAQIRFNPNSAELTHLLGNTGKSDFEIQGTITNLLGYVLNEESIKGQFTMRSGTLDLNDFLAQNIDPVNGEKSSESKFEIPGFLDAVIQTQATTLIYDDLVLSDVRGALMIRDKQATIQDARSGFLGGTLMANGSINTQKEQPEFAVELALKDNGIAELLEATTFFETLVPIANGIQGTMDSKFLIRGGFKDGFTLDYESLSGQAQTELKALDKILGETSLIRGINQKLNFLQGNNLDLKGLKTVLKFKDGRVEVSPFQFMIKDIGVAVRGSHTFDAAMNYSIEMDVPAYYLGDEVNRLIAQLNDPNIKNVPVPVNVTITGTYDQPEIGTDLSQSVTKLTGRLVEYQKQKALQKGTDTAKDFLGGIFVQEKDSLNQQDSKPSLGGVLGEVLKGGGTQKDSSAKVVDSTKGKTPSIKETATGILGGILKKKKDSVPKDSMNR